MSPSTPWNISPEATIACARSGRGKNSETVILYQDATGVGRDHVRLGLRRSSQFTRRIGALGHAGNSSLAGSVEQGGTSDRNTHSAASALARITERSSWT